jgi:hypothetical protein
MGIIGMQKDVTLFAAMALLALVSCSKRQESPEKSVSPAPPPAPAASQAEAAANPHNALAAPLMGAKSSPPAAKGADGRYAIGSLQVRLPDTWESQALSSSMRKGQFAVPPAAGDSEGAELVVYYFGQSGAGSVEANLERWYGQIQQPDGSSTKAAAKTETFTAGTSKVTVVDVSGRYVAAVVPGAAEKHDQSNYRMVAAIIEAADGAYYFKMLGPEKTVGAAAPALVSALKGLDG